MFLPFGGYFMQAVWWYNILIYVAYNKNILDKLLDNYFYKNIISKKCLDFLLGFDATSKVLLI